METRPSSFNNVQMLRESWTLYNEEVKVEPLPLTFSRHPHLPLSSLYHLSQCHTFLLATKGRPYSQHHPSRGHTQAFQTGLPAVPLVLGSSANPEARGSLNLYVSKVTPPIKAFSQLPISPRRKAKFCQQSTRS